MRDFRVRDARGSRITNDPRASASPRRAGNLQSVLSTRQRQNSPSRAMRSHPTGFRRGLSGRMFRAVRPPVAGQSVRNSREMYLRGVSSSASAMPTFMIVKRISSAHFICVMFTGCARSASAGRCCGSPSPCCRSCARARSLRSSRRGSSTRFPSADAPTCRRCRLP